MSFTVAMGSSNASITGMIPCQWNISKKAKVAKNTTPDHIATRAMSPPSRKTRTIPDIIIDSDMSQANGIDVLYKKLLILRLEAVFDSPKPRAIGTAIKNANVKTPECQILPKLMVKIKK